MNIAIICYPTHGGSGVVATELGVGLAQKGHQIHFISYSSPFRLRGFQENVFYHEVDVSAYPLFKYPPYDLSLATKIIEVSKENQLDVVHAHYAIPHATSAYLAKQMMRGKGPKIVTTLHGTDITLVGKDPTFYQAVKFSIEESDGVTAVSNYLRDKSIKEFHLTNSIKTVYNFVDTDRFSGRVERCSKDTFAPQGEKLLLHASNFRTVKRIADTIRILAKVREKIPTKLLLIGEGPERQKAHELAVNLDVHDQVIFLGTQDYIENLLGCADLFLLPSSEESFGLAALEAMSCQTPVIGSNIGGIPEVVADGETGFLHPVGAIDSMAESVLTLLSDSVKLDQFAKAARQRARDLFSDEKIIPQYEQFYKDISSQ